MYLLASKRNGTLYIGVTRDIASRIDQHQSNAVKSFSSKYHVYYLVWHEWHDTIEQAITREKQLKKWNRAWKVRLIENTNPEWEDLAQNLLA